MIERVQGIKVVTASEMAEVERRAIHCGASALVFMQQAAQGIGVAVEEFALENSLRLFVTLLVGKGNNGGDALAAGVFLLQRGFTVAAVCLYPLSESSALCKHMREQFVACGGRIYEVSEDSPSGAPLGGILVDGLVGTAFRGRASGPLASLIKRANGSGCPILAVDIPSGVDGDTGEAFVAIRATQTLYLELPKRGFFVGDGWNHVGTLRRIGFGLSESSIEDAKEIAYLADEAALFRLLPPIKRNRHKYEAGYVLACAGSPGMPGAALLSCSAALKAGAGIVRLFYPEEMRAELTNAPYELILQPWDIKKIREEAARAKAVLIGPGMGRSKEAGRSCAKLVSTLSLPLVVDGDALFFAGAHPEWIFPEESILTPHRGEMRGLLKNTTSQLPIEEQCQAYAEAKGVTVILKGGVTWIFHPHTTPFVCLRGDPGMATAGSGDVLAGMVAAFVAQGVPSWLAALLAVHLHGSAGERAAAALTSYCLTASDLIDYLPDAFLDAKGMA